MTTTGTGDASRRDPDALRRRAGVSGDPAQDQHFLVDDRVLNRLPTYAEEFDLSHVLEIGAGTGALTDRLLQRADRVTAIERDPNLVAFLRTEFREPIDNGHLDVVEADALEVDYPKYTCSISNLPYGVSSEVLFRLLPRRRPLLVMVQRAFGERMVADPGTEDYGRLSVTARHYGAVEMVEPVPREAFDPVPEVESAIIRVTPREPIYDVDEDVFHRLVRALFTQRRKTVRNAIKNTIHISEIANPDIVLEMLDPEMLAARPGSLSPEDFAHIANVVVESGDSS